MIVFVVARQAPKQLVLKAGGSKSLNPWLLGRAEASDDTTYAVDFSDISKGKIGVSVKTNGGISLVMMIWYNYRHEKF